MEFKDITVIKNKNTPFEKIIFKNLNYTIHNKKINLIVGANGSGKTTLLEAILKLTNAEGNIPHIDYQKIAYIPQNVEKILFKETIYEEIITISKNYYKPIPNEKKINEMLLKFNLKEIDLQKSPHELSGGEQKKIALIASLIHNPEIIIMDEPTASLDGPSKKILIDYIQKSNQTYVIITHDPALFEKLNSVIFKML